MTRKMCANCWQQRNPDCIPDRVIVNPIFETCCYCLKLTTDVVAVEEPGFSSHVVGFIVGAVGLFAFALAVPFMMIAAMIQCLAMGKSPFGYDDEKKN